MLENDVLPQTHVSIDLAKIFEQQRLLKLGAAQLPNYLPTTRMPAPGSLSPGSGSLENASYASVDKVSASDSMWERLGLNLNLGRIPLNPGIFYLATGIDHAKLNLAEREFNVSVIEGQSMACFRWGGENRLCFPQLVRMVLQEFQWCDIQKMITDLNIFCPKCSREQLETFIRKRILPQNSESCSLITQTDAQRLCNALLRKQSPARPQPLRPSGTRAVSLSIVTGVGSGAVKAEPLSSPTGKLVVVCQKSQDLENVYKYQTPSLNKLPVYHECFGRCRGLFLSDRYTASSSLCIECVECGELFAPERFVIHSHRPQDTHTHYWGFDSANWRSYLRLAYHIKDDEQCIGQLDTMKLKFDNAGLYKRKLIQQPKLPDLPDVKRTRLSSSESSAAVPVNEHMSRSTAINNLLASLNRWNIPTSTAPTLQSQQLMQQYLEMMNSSKLATAASSNCSGPQKTGLDQLAEEATAARQRELDADAAAKRGLVSHPERLANAIVRSVVENNNDRLREPVVIREHPKKFLLHKAQHDQDEQRAEVAEHGPATPDTIVVDVDTEEDSLVSSETILKRDMTKLSLDSLLKCAIPDDDMRKLVRSKIAESQNDIMKTCDQHLFENTRLKKENAILKTAQNIDIYRRIYCPATMQHMISDRDRIISSAAP